MGIEFKIEGGKELERNLRRLGERIEKNVGRSAARAGAAIFRKQMRAILPQDNEDDIHLAKSVEIKASRRSNLHIVGVKGPAARYAHKLEFDKRGEFAKYNRLWTKTFRRLVPSMLDAMAKKVRAGIAKHGG